MRLWSWLMGGSGAIEVKSVISTGEHSHYIVLLRAWFLRVGKPKKVKMVVEEDRLSICPLRDNEPRK